jgi:TRAP-type C4-dicarboxylate transport system permease large subunit
MKKIKSPWYGLIWIAIWTVAVVWFLKSGMFNERESIGLILVWVILVGITVYLLIQHLRFGPGTKKTPIVSPASPPALNAECPCGSGKKYKRCCGAAGK